MKKLGIITVISLLIDQLTKWLITSNLKITETISIIPNFFRITYLQNTGGAFSILSKSLPLLIVLTVVILFIIIWIIKKMSVIDTFNIITYGILIGGILGNFIDRIRLGYVIDFLDFNIGSYHYPVFNIADIMIVVSCIILIIKNIKEGKNDVESRNK